MLRRPLLLGLCSVILAPSLAFLACTKAPVAGGDAASDDDDAGRGDGGSFDDVFIPLSCGSTADCVQALLDAERASTS